MAKTKLAAVGAGSPEYNAKCAVELIGEACEEMESLMRELINLNIRDNNHVARCISRRMRDIASAVDSLVLDPESSDTEPEMSSADDRAPRRDSRPSGRFSFWALILVHRLRTVTKRRHQLGRQIVSW